MHMHALLVFSCFFPSLSAANTKLVIEDEQRRPCNADLWNGPRGPTHFHWRPVRTNHSLLVVDDQKLGSRTRRNGGQHRRGPSLTHKSSCCTFGVLLATISVLAPPPPRQPVVAIPPGPNSCQSPPSASSASCRVSSGGPWSLDVRSCRGGCPVCRPCPGRYFGTIVGGLLTMSESTTRDIAPPRNHFLPNPLSFLERLSNHPLKVLVVDFTRTGPERRCFDAVGTSGRFSA